MNFNFPEKVCGAFGFLDAEHGFKCVAKDPFRVRYESSNVYVDIQFDGSRSYELDVSFGLLSNEKEPAFGLDELLRCFDVREVDARGSAQITTPEMLEKFLSVFADTLARFGQRILAGDPMVFEQLADYRDVECNRYALDSKMRRIRSILEVAWTNKEYREVVDLLNPVAEHLSEAERKKLRYAKSRL